MLEEINRYLLCALIYYARRNQSLLSVCFYSLCLKKSIDT